MTIVIRCFASWCDSYECKKVFEDICEKHLLSLYGENIRITTEDDYTHVIILNTAMPNIKSNIPISNVVGFAHEPISFLGLSPEFIEYAQKYIGRYFIGDKFDLPEPFIEGNSYLWYNTPLTYLPKKINKTNMSIMVSHKNYAPGHTYRHILVQRILELKLPIDIYGNGSEMYNSISKKNKYIKGRFDKNEPYETYQFHICIENFQSNHYFSEKIINTLLCGTTPVYIGCRSIDNYFPNTVIKMNGYVEKDILLIKDILKSPEKYVKNIDIEYVKNKVNLLKNIENIYSDIYHTYND
jgi:hypothetical protein